MISRRSLFGFALVPLAAKPWEIARAEAYGAALGARTAAQMAPMVAALIRIRDAGSVRESIMALRELDQSEAGKPCVK